MTLSSSEAYASIATWSVESLYVELVDITIQNPSALFEAGSELAHVESHTPALCRVADLCKKREFPKERTLWVLNHPWNAMIIEEDDK